MNASVFISYRREDASGHAGRLSDRLIARFGAARVFMDVQDILPGQNFAQAIDRTLAQCDHLLAIIGPRWLQDLAARQIANEDFVRHELSAALTRGLTVIPVLVGGAKMPRQTDLPTELAAFAQCQAVEVRDDRFDEDTARLISFLAGERRRGVQVFAGALLALAVALVAGWLLWPTPAVVIDGEWIAELHKPGQPPYRIRLTLAREGEQLIGTVQYPTGDGPILDGRYAEGRMTFHTAQVPNFESAPATVSFQARVEGDVMRLITVDDAGTAIGTAHRAGAKPVGAPPRVRSAVQ